MRLSISTVAGYRIIIGGKPKLVEEGYFEVRINAGWPI